MEDIGLGKRKSYRETRGNTALGDQKEKRYCNSRKIVWTQQKPSIGEEPIEDSDNYLDNN